MTPEQILDEAFDNEGVAQNHRDDIKAYLHALKNRDPKTYEHSIRVGVLASRVALYAAKPGISARMLLWAGLLHDIGKTLVRPEVLTKTSNFTQEDYAAIEPHVQYGWDMLNRVHDWTAYIIVRHHQFRAKPYPAELPPLPEYLRDKAEIIQVAARLCWRLQIFLTPSPTGITTGTATSPLQLGKNAKSTCGITPTRENSLSFLNQLAC